MFINNDGLPVIPDQASQDATDLFIEKLTTWIYEHEPSLAQHALGYDRLRDLIKFGITELASLI